MLTIAKPLDRSMKIFLEGPDGSGKTTLFEHIQSALPGPVSYKSLGRPPESVQEFLFRCTLAVKSRGPIVIDRCPIIGELIYGTIIRGEPIVDTDFLVNMLKRLDSGRKNVVFIYCRQPDDYLMSLPVPEKPHKSKDHCEGVLKNRRRILDAYDWIFNLVLRNRYTVIDYDWKQMKEGELWSCVESI